MRALLQRVSRAEVRIANDVLGRIDQGLVVFLGVGTHDVPDVADSLARRIVDLRVFADEAGKTNRSLLDVNGEMLVVSQFTLYADTSRGRRPGFAPAAPPDAAVPLYERFCAAVEAAEVTVVRGDVFARNCRERGGCWRNRIRRPGRSRARAALPVLSAAAAALEKISEPEMSDCTCGVCLRVCRSHQLLTLVFT